MKTSLEMFGYNIALKNVLDMFDCNVTLDGLCEDIDYAISLTFNDMEYWIDKDMTQFRIAETQYQVYSIVVADIDFCIMHKDTNPSLAQTQVGNTYNVVRHIYKLF